MTVRVRLFAGAAEAVGRAEWHTDSATVGELIAEMTAAGGPETAEVLDRCSLLIDGTRAKGDEQELPAAATVDVLPPFAGG